MNYLDFTWSFTHDRTQKKNVVVYEDGKITNLIRTTKYIYPYVEIKDVYEDVMYLIAETNKKNLITFDLCTVFEKYDEKEEAVSIGGIVSIPHDLRKDTDIILDLLCDGITDRRIKIVYINPADNFITKEQADNCIKEYLGDEASLETVKREIIL